MSKNIFTYTKDEWINCAKQGEPDYGTCFIPVIRVNYLHEVNNTDEFSTLKSFIQTGGYQMVHHHLKSNGLLPLKLDYDIVSAIHTVTTKSDNQPSLEQQFLDKQRNIFIIEISDHTFSGKDLIFTCEYMSTGQPLADYTVDYDAVTKRDKERQSIEALFARLRQKRNDTDVDDLF